MKNERFLIVEDDDIAVSLFQRILNELGYQISSIVRSGEEAIEKAETDKPDLILMDIKLQGGMDGIAASEIIRKKAQTPVVFLSAHSDEEILERVKLTGPFGYILKPVKSLDLKIAIEMALNASKIDTKRIKAEEELERIFDLVPDLICTVSADGYFENLNPAWKT